MDGLRIIFWGENMKYSICICICNVCYNEDSILNTISDVQIVRIFNDFETIEDASNFIEFLGQKLSKNDYWIISEDDFGNIVDLEKVYYHEDGIDVLDEPKMYYDLFKIYQDRYLG